MVVAEEEYFQRVFGLGLAGPPISRSLRSEYLMMRLAGSGELIEFRDVIAIVGRALSGREGRLERLLLNPSPDSLEQASAIAIESSSYSLRSGPVPPLVSTPLVGMAVLQPRYASRLRFEVEQLDVALGPRVRILSYREATRPTILRRGERDAPLSGRVWLDEESGRVWRTELRVERTLVETEFRFDEALQMDVPARMRIQDRGASREFAGTATYGRFRRFRVTASEQVQ
jgi:hypothetical protein